MKIVGFLINITGQFYPIFEKDHEEKSVFDRKRKLRHPVRVTRLSFSILGVTIKIFFWKALSK